jgi:hypothetical protein
MQLLESKPTEAEAVAALADISLEFGHLYLYPPRSGRMKSHMREVRRTFIDARYLVDIHTAAGLSVSTVVMVDDVSESYPYTDEDLRAMLADWPLQPDYLARESAMIPLVERHMPGESVDCSHLATAWYLARLGWPGFEIEPVKLRADAAAWQAERLYSVLPARFMDVEAGVRRRLRSDFQVPHDRVKWVFA